MRSHPPNFRPAFLNVVTGRSLLQGRQSDLSKVRPVFPVLPIVVAVARLFRGLYAKMIGGKIESISYRSPYSRNWSKHIGIVRQKQHHAVARIPLDLLWYKVMGINLYITSARSVISEVRL